MSLLKATRTHMKTLLLFLFFSSSILAQIRTKEIGLLTDNDSYTSFKNDKYYTNGLTLFYRYLGKNTNNNIAKKTNKIFLGQYIYTPRFTNKTAINKNDRPFAGYLFTGFEKSFFYKNYNVLQVGFQIGSVGPRAYGQEVQNTIHETFSLKKPYGWENQIHNAVAIQSNFIFSVKLFPKTEQNTIDFNWKSEVNMGTVFSRISTGLVTRIGFKKLVPVWNSNMYGASVGTIKGTNNEFYFYLAPNIRYQLYDATIQGGLFSDTSPVTFTPMPFCFNAKAGLVYQKNNFNLSYSFVYNSKEVKNSPSTSYYYGSIGFSFLL